MDRIKSEVFTGGGRQKQFSLFHGICHAESFAFGYFSPISVVNNFAELSDKDLFDSVNRIAWLYAHENEIHIHNSDVDSSF